MCRLVCLFIGGIVSTLVVFLFCSVIGTLICLFVSGIVSTLIGSVLFCLCDSSSKHSIRTALIQSLCEQCLFYLRTKLYVKLCSKVCIKLLFEHTFKLFIEFGLKFGIELFFEFFLKFSVKLIGKLLFKFIIQLFVQLFFRFVKIILFDVRFCSCLDSRK